MHGPISKEISHIYSDCSYAGDCGKEKSNKLNVWIEYQNICGTENLYPICVFRMKYIHFSVFFSLKKFSLLVKFSNPQRFRWVLIWFFTPQSTLVMSGRVFLGWFSGKPGWMYLVQGHNAVTPARLEPVRWVCLSRCTRCVWKLMTGYVRKH